jgi:hypothetical protein
MMYVEYSVSSLNCWLWLEISMGIPLQVKMYKWKFGDISPYNILHLLSSMILLGLSVLELMAMQLPAWSIAVSFTCFYISWWCLSVVESWSLLINTDICNHHIKNGLLGHFHPSMAFYLISLNHLFAIDHRFAVPSGKLNSASICCGCATCGSSHLGLISQFHI